jgi:hypothetical protein
MEIEDLKTVLYFHIHKIGTTPAISQYIAASKQGDVQATAARWNALTKAEQAIVLEAYNRLRLESPA